MRRAISVWVKIDSHRWFLAGGWLALLVAG